MANIIQQFWATPQHTNMVVWDGDIDWFLEYAAERISKSNPESEDPYIVTENEDGTLSIQDWESTRTLRPGDVILGTPEGDFQFREPGDWQNRYSTWFAGWDPVTETWN